MSETERILDEEWRNRTGELRSRVSIVNAQAGSDEDRRLIVFVHGASRRSGDQIAQFLTFARHKFGQAELAYVRYQRGTMFGTTPFGLTSDLQAELARHLWHRRKERRKGGDPEFQFSQIIIVAYSAGALLSRKALAWIHGQDEDHPEHERSRRMKRVGDELGLRKIPLRLVLLAGMTRGWTLEDRGAGSTIETAALRMLRVLASSLKTVREFVPFWRWSYPGRFLLGLERGSRFVANLRIQWLKTRRKLEVVQILGFQDQLVRVDDHYDMAIGTKFALMTVPHRDHKSIWKLAGEGDLFEKCISAPMSELRKCLEHRPVKLPVADEKGVVFIMHGIRDNSDWPRELAHMIEVGRGEFHCVTSSYGHFPMTGFLSKARRARNVRWFMDQYAETMSRRSKLLETKDAKELPVHFVGHSNGTYLLAEGLRTYASLRVNRAAFMGSVVPRDFPWDRFGTEERLLELRNDRGGSDWVVGWFPTFYQVVRELSWRLFRRPETNDIGNGGFRGFDNAAPKHHENYYFPGGHGSMITRDNLLSIAGYVTTGTNPETPSPLVRKPSGLVSFVWRLCWLLWIILFGGILLGAHYSGVFGASLGDGLWWQYPAGVGTWVGFWFLVFETA